MTPQEHQLVDELFDRLTQLETTPRDPDAERLITDGTRRAPHSLYALVQTALVQDEALKRANARIEDLQAQLSEGEEPPHQQTGFLDSMREAVFGHGEARGSVPTVRAGASSAMPGASGYAPPSGYAEPRPGFPPQSAYPMGPAFGGGGSFLGTAASTAAGMIGGGLLLDGIRSMFGHHAGAGGLGQSAFGNLGGQASPWSGNAADSDLAKQAGIDSIGRDYNDDKNSQSDDSNSQSDSGAWADSADDQNADDNDSDDDQDSDFGDSGGDTDDA